MLPVCSWQPFLKQHIYQRKKSGVYSELSAIVGEFWKMMIVGPSSINRFGMEYNGELYGFSAVKVKLVDSLI